MTHRSDRRVRVKRAKSAARERKRAFVLESGMTKREIGFFFFLLYFLRPIDRNQSSNLALMDPLPADLRSLCSRSAMELALACASSAALGAAAVAALGLFAGERRKKKSVVVVEKKEDFSPLAPTKPLAASVAPCCEHEEHDENAAPSSSSAAPPSSSKVSPFDARPRSR